MNPDNKVGLETGGNEVALAHYNATELENAIQQDMNIWAGFSLPEVVTMLFPPLLVALWQHLCAKAASTAREFPRLAIGLPRGIGKSFIIKLWIAWVVVFTKRKFILIVAANESRAQDVLADAWDIIISDNFRSLFGDVRISQTTDTKGVKKFLFRGRNVIIAALGKGQSLRGISTKYARPDVIVCDDLQTKEEAKSPAESKALREWVQGTLLKAGDKMGTLVVYIGNMYPNLKDPGGMYTCLLRNYKDDPHWTSIILGALLADGESIWEDMLPKETLLAELEFDIAAGTPEIWFSEVQNDPDCGLLGRIDFRLVPHPPADLLSSRLGSFIIVDPATNKINADDIVVTYGELHGDLPVVMEIHRDKWSPIELVTFILDLCATKNCRVVGVESVSYQYSLLQWLEFFAETTQLLGVNFLELMPGGINKNSRILNMFKQLLKGEILLHDDVRQTVQLQAATFDPTKTTNEDDILDTIAYIPQLQQLAGGSIMDPDEMTQAGFIREQTTGSIGDAAQTSIFAYISRR